MLRNKRLNLSLLLATALAIFFWTQSRVPALNEKAQMGLRTQFNEIAFDVVLPVAAEQGFIERVLRSSVNWAYTNWKGMTFGLLFAAAALLILGSLRRRSFTNPWLNTFFGAAAGAPLGVCVNCATPIAQGIYSAGAKLETALGALIASPTLNVIVLTMSFTILPWEIATAKLAGVAVMLAALPLLVRSFSPDAGPAAPASEVLFDSAALPASATKESWGSALRAVTSDYLRHLWYIIRLAVPLMLLAGVLGALAVEIVPFDLFATRPASIGLIILAAVVATLLPVPIAFDVIVVSALLAAGADAGLATAILFALGIYSIYPALVIARQASVRLSAAMAVLVTTIALGLALATQGYSSAGIETERLIIARGLTENVHQAFDAAMSVCDELPESLHERCFTDQLDKFEPYLDDAALCDVRPNGLDTNACRDIVRSSALARIAKDERDLSACSQLEDTAQRSSCELAIVLQRAIEAHDVDECSALSDTTALTSCRTQYVSGSLLFNPDDSVCRNLSGPELTDCRTNARVYRLAETMNFAGCAAFRSAEQREFCRYVIASSMIGRQNDASGCAQLSAPDLISRCHSQVFAWEAQRERSPERCGLVSDPAIQATCHLRVAGIRIDALLSAVTVSSGFDAIESASSAGLQSHAQPQAAPEIDWQLFTSDAARHVQIAALAPGSAQGDRQFRQVKATDLGIDNPWQFRSTDFFEPFIVGKGIASGDFNADGWPDLVFAGNAGISVYQNIGGRFERAPVKLGELAAQNTFLVAFVDANNDALPDIFISAYGGSNYLLLNSGGSFSNGELVELPGERRLTFAAGFGDLDGNGRLDIVHGNWTSGVERLFSPDQSANEILFARDDGYEVVLPPEVVGETLSVLLSDIDVDGDLDMLVGNDRIVPDMNYLNRGDGTFSLVDARSGVFPVTSMFTMSIDAADFNNDLIPDLFSTDMTFARSSHDAYCDALDNDEQRAHCETLLGTYEGLQSGSALACSEIESQIARRDCFTAFAIQAAKDLKDPAYCERLPADALAAASLCHHLASPVPPEESLDQSDYVRQVQRNTLLIGTDNGFVEQAETQGVDSSFWSWNGKAADLDNDGWQDIYVGNGFHFGDNFYEIQENVLYRNIDGEHFEERAADWGLNDPLNTPAYTYIDFDRDGDLDIISTGVLAPPRIFVNEEADGHSLVVQLVDEQGNSAGIGSVVTIGYAGAQKRQRREIRLSGGFLSFDEPVAHFGLGDSESIDWLEVRWPDGERSRIDEPVEADHWLRIRRPGEH